MEVRKWDKRKWLRGQFQNHQEDICQIKKKREASDRISSPLSFDFFKLHITKFHFKRLILQFYSVSLSSSLLLSNPQREFIKSYKLLC